MKKAITTEAPTTFSLSDYHSGERTKLESQIMERALELWRKKHPFRSPPGPPSRNRFS